MKRNYTARVWAVLLSLVLVLSFAGCKSGNSTSESGSNQQKTTQIATDTSAEKQTTEPKEAKDKDKKDSGAKAEKDATSEKTVSSEQSTQKASTKTTKGAAKTTAATKRAQTKTTANKPVIMEDQEEELISVILPKEWYDLDELYQFTVEAGIFNSIIDLDYDFL